MPVCARQLLLVWRLRNGLTNPRSFFRCNLRQLRVFGTDYLSRSFRDTTLVETQQLGRPHVRLHPATLTSRNPTTNNMAAYSSLPGNSHIIVHRTRGARL